MLPTKHLADTAHTNEEEVDEIDPCTHLVKNLIHLEFRTYVPEYLKNKCMDHLI